MRRPIFGTLAAIAVTTAMDAYGLSVFSALPLFPLLVIFWFWEGYSRQQVGFIWGRLGDYLPAVLYPLVVLGAAAAIALLAGAVDISETNWNHFWVNLLAGGASSVVVVAVTEEGFFRGWLWASLKNAGRGSYQTLLWSSLAFSIWHLSAVSLDTGFDLPAKQIPVFMVNALLLGVIWGLLRLGSGSVAVASVSHGMWNGLNYALFAFGTKVGALGVKQTSIYGPEVGWVGLALNAAFAAGLWWWGRRGARFRNSGG